MATSNITTYELPLAIAEKLVCTHCNVYVSCGPVNVQADGAAVCGRCSLLNDEDASRQTLYEAAMSSFIFPCRYLSDGCKTRVLFNQAIEHENNCPYKTVCCPALPHGSCANSVSVFDVHDHFKESHEDLIMEEGNFKLEFQEDIHCNLVMVEDIATMVVQYSYDSNSKTLKVNVQQFSRDDQQIVYYKLQIISGNDSDNTIYLKERQCCYYDSHTINLENAVTLEMDNYLPILENPSCLYICVKLKAYPVKKLTENNSELIAVTCRTQCGKNEFEEFDLAMWNELEDIRCTYCQSFAIPPIYFEYSTNCICKECKGDRDRRTLEEKIVEIANFPCCWWGCSFVGNNETIAAHVDSCQYRSYRCPVSSICKEGYFTGNNIMEHMGRHGTYCPNPENIIIDLFQIGNEEEENNKVYFTFCNHQVISISCSVFPNRSWRLSGNTDNLQVSVYFKHDHCRFKSKTYNFITPLNMSYSDYLNSFPKCFKGSCIMAVIKLQTLF